MKMVIFYFPCKPKACSQGVFSQHEAPIHCLISLRGAREPFCPPATYWHSNKNTHFNHDVHRPSELRFYPGLTHNKQYPAIAPKSKTPKGGHPGSLAGMQMGALL